MLSRLGEFFGLQEVQLGDRDFDERFVVKASDALRASEVLNESFRTGMQELATWAETVRDRSELGSRYIEFRLERGAMQLRLHSYLESTEKLITFAAHGGRLYDIFEKSEG